ncbi:MAG: nucleoside deaminase [Saprospiraceae bacterium]
MKFNTYMEAALSEARAAAKRGEVPVGAVVVCQGQIIARAHNLSERLHDFTAHAEMQAFTAASEYLGGKYLNQCILYVTLEPCLMCGGAAAWTRIGKIIFGAFDEKKGFTQYQHLKEGSSSVLHPKTTFQGGVKEDECKEILQRFFKEKR